MRYAAGFSTERRRLTLGLRVMRPPRRGMGRGERRKLSAVVSYSVLTRVTAITSITVRRRVPERPARPRARRAGSPWREPDYSKLCGQPPAVRPRKPGSRHHRTHNDVRHKRSTILNRPSCNAWPARHRCSIRAITNSPAATTLRSSPAMSVAANGKGERVRRIGAGLRGPRPRPQAFFRSLIGSSPISPD
jgi:hypothetical protein